MSATPAPPEHEYHQIRPTIYTTPQYSSFLSHRPTVTRATTYDAADPIVEPEGESVKREYRMSTLERAVSRAATYLLRLPIVTKAVLLICILCFVVMRTVFDVMPGFNLDSTKMDLFQMHRLNTYPIVHLDMFHLIFDLVPLTPMLGNFERERGTLYTLLQILGPFSTFPAILYLILQYTIFRGHATPIVGSSVWVFLFLAVEAVKSSRLHPYYSIAKYKIPTWSTPIGLVILVEILFPVTASLVGHLCALVVGYAYALGYLRLFEPSEKILKFVESKVGFILFRVPYYVSLEKREFEDGESAGSFLPKSSPRPTDEGGNEMSDSFIGQGRALGSTRPTLTNRMMTS